VNGQKMIRVYDLFLAYPVFMPTIELRKNLKERGPSDIQVSVQDRTFEYLMTSTSKEIRISTYFDKEYTQVDEKYEGIFVSEDCLFESKIVGLSPGSMTRKGLKLPCEMHQGDQLVVIVTRRSLSE